MEISDSTRYLLVTPAKNEERFIGDLIDSVKNQSIKPVLWVIVDDGSTDKTTDILEKAASDVDWIDILHLPQGERMRGQHYAYVCKQGFDYVTDKVTEWDYIGLVDADMILEHQYFEKLIREFEKNEKLGIVSGEIYNSFQDVKGQFKRRDNEAVGGCRLFSKECLFDIGGYLSYPGRFDEADSIMNTKAKIRGWSLQIFPEIKAIHRRPIHSVEGAWKSAVLRANLMYYFDYHPLLAIGAFLSLLTIKPYYHAFVFLIKYMKNIIARREKIPDQEIRDFYRKEKCGEVLRNISVYWRS